MRTLKNIICVMICLLMHSATMYSTQITSVFNSSIHSVAIEGIGTSQFGEITLPAKTIGYLVAYTSSFQGPFTSFKVIYETDPIVTITVYANSSSGYSLLMIGDLISGAANVQLVPASGPILVIPALPS